MSQIKQTEITESSTTVTRPKVLELIQTFFRRTSNWLWFVVISAMIPFFSQGWLIAETEHLSLFDVCKKTISHGELIQLSLALLAGSLAELMKSKTKYELTKETFKGFCLILLILAAIAYGHYFADPYGTLGDTQEAFRASVYIFVMTFITCSASTAISNS